MEEVRQCAFQSNTDLLVKRCLCRVGRAVVLLPKEAAWQTFLNGLNGFTDDFFQNGRELEVPTQRETL